jgi:ElaB/YqjD/DUF883 family membrane-anchored ribosome-binding protein
MSEPNTRQLIDDLRAVVADAEALLNATAHSADERAHAMREKAAGTIEQARARLESLEHEFGAQAKAVAADAHRYVRDNPWQSLGIAAVAGLVIGVLLGRR